MSSINKKKYFLICCFAVALTFLILLCFIFFIIRSGADMQAIPGTLYFGETRSEILTNPAISSQHLYEYFRESLFQYLPLLIATICFFILILSGVLLYGIKQLDQKHHDEIADDLIQVAHDDINFLHEPLLSKEYQLINQKICAYDEDQRRLHSYIAHEQKNLIMLIKGKIPADDDFHIQQDIERLTESVDDILALSAHKDASKALCDLAMITAEECDRYQFLYPKLTFNFDEDAAYTILAKEQWLRRAVDNLIENAIKYGDDKPINVYLKQKYNSVLLYVQDFGKGFNEQEQYHIFDYGYRIHPLKKDGYGIGLSLVCHVCDLCDGFINVKSKPDEGSLFIVSFPLEVSIA